MATDKSTGEVAHDADHLELVAWVLSATVLILVLQLEILLADEVAKQMFLIGDGTTI